MAIYELPNAVNVSEGIGGTATYLSSVTGSWFWNLILMAIYIIFAVSVGKRDVPEGLAVAGFVTAILGTLMWIGNWISGVTFAFALAVAIAGASVLWLSKPR